MLSDGSKPDITNVPIKLNQAANAHFQKTLKSHHRTSLLHCGTSVFIRMNMGTVD